MTLDLTGADAGDLGPVAADVAVDIDGLTVSRAPAAPVPLPEVPEAPVPLPAYDGEVDGNAATVKILEL